MSQSTKMTPQEFEEKCRDLCPHCRAGEVVRLRLDTMEYVHDFSFGVDEAKRTRTIGHGLCLAHDFRKQNG